MLVPRNLILRYATKANPKSLVDGGGKRNGRPGFSQALCRRKILIVWGLFCFASGRTKNKQFMDGPFNVGASSPIIILYSQDPPRLGFPHSLSEARFLPAYFCHLQTASLMVGQSLELSFAIAKTIAKQATASLAVNPGVGWFVPIGLFTLKQCHLSRL